MAKSEQREAPIPPNKKQAVAAAAAPQPLGVGRRTQRGKKETVFVTTPEASLKRASSRPVLPNMLYHSIGYPEVSFKLCLIINKWIVSRTSCCHVVCCVCVVSHKLASIQQLGPSVSKSSLDTRYCRDSANSSDGTTRRRAAAEPGGGGVTWLKMESSSNGAPASRWS